MTRSLSLKCSVIDEPSLGSIHHFPGKTQEHSAYWVLECQLVHFSTSNYSTAFFFIGCIPTFNCCGSSEGKVRNEPPAQSSSFNLTIIIALGVPQIASFGLQIQQAVKSIICSFSGHHINSHHSQGNLQPAPTPVPGM